MKHLLSQKWFGPLVALVVVYVGFLILRPETFGRAATLLTMSQQTVIVAVAAVGATLVIVSGGIDLSVGSSVALTSVVIAKLLVRGHGPVVAAVGGCLVATACGTLNGVRVARVKLLPFIVTLGTMSILRGAAKGLANEQKIDAPARGLETLLAPTASLRPPSGVFLAMVVAVLVAGILSSTRFGRHVFAVGSNERTARLCGVPVPQVKIGVYALAGFLAGLAGVLEFSMLTVGDPTTAVGLELEVIAAVVIGGASLSGGEGSILGAMIGAFLMTVIKTGATHMGLPNWVQEILTGAIILVASGLDRLRRRSSNEL